MRNNLDVAAAVTEARRIRFEDRTVEALEAIAATYPYEVQSDVMLALRRKVAMPNAYVPDLFEVNI